MDIQLSKTSAQILQLFLENSNKPLYINEIIRLTSSYPNSVQQSLKTLKKQNLLVSNKVGNKSFYSVDTESKRYPLIKSAVLECPLNSSSGKPKYIKWVNRECSVALNTAIGSAQADMKYIKRFRISPVKFLWYNSVTGGVYNSLQEIEQIGKDISQEVKNDSEFAQELADSCIRDGNRLIAETKNLSKKGLEVFTDKQLYNMFDKLHELFLNFMPYFVIPHAIEKAIEVELDRLITNEQAKKKLVEPVTILSEEQIDEMKLAGAVKKEGWNSKNKKSLIRTTEKYCWMPMMALHHKPFDAKHFKQIVNGLIKSVRDPFKELEKLKKQQEERKTALESTLDQIQADQELRNLVHTTQAYLNLRTFRVNITKQFHYYHLPILYEIAKRIGISNEEIALLTYYEVLESLNKEITVKGVQTLVDARKRGFANLTWNGESMVIAGPEAIVEAMERYGIVAKTSTIEQVIKGNTACKGFASGTVRIIKDKSELHKMKKGDVLVARMTTPDYMAAIKKASAIVTDEGGITCHASIVSREFNIPCIVGTKNATHILNEGDLVEVDANEGTVRIVTPCSFDKNVEELFGTTIYKGKVTGKARVILDVRDFDKLEDGDIIIAAQTNPEYLSLLYRARGFVVDEEQISSHAVLYGKALRMPSIMGTVQAKAVFEDGEKIELNATKGFVRTLK